MWKKYDTFQVRIHAIHAILVLLILGSCHSETTTVPSVEITELVDYETIYSFDESRYDSTAILAPSILTVDGRSNLFVYDRRRNMVVVLDGGGEVINEVGREGQGPGEFRFVNSITLEQDNLYLVDHWQFFIHKYYLTGEPISSMDYGSYTRGGQTMLNLLSSIVPEGVQSLDIDNRPFVLPGGNVLLPLGRADMGRAIFELRDWEGNHLTDIGEIPEGSLFLPEGGGDVFLSAIKNHEIPGIVRPRAFPVADPANHGEFLLIYSAAGRIVKYDTTGTKLWESDIQPTPEIDAITHDYFTSMEQQNNPGNQRNPGTCIGMLRKYTRGVSSPEGELYLATYTDPDNTVSFSNLSEPLWIHQFNSEGELINRYKMISGTGASLPSVFDIDFDSCRIFVVTTDGEIRAYLF